VAGGQAGGEGGWEEGEAPSHSFPFRMIFVFVDLISPSKGVFKNSNTY
jgi:hypothetical protein